MLWGFKGLTWSLLVFVKAVFYVYSFLWSLMPRKALWRTVLKLFYCDFLRLDKLDVEVVKLDENELVTHCKSLCPILRIALCLKLDTMRDCREERIYLRR